MTTPTGTEPVPAPGAPPGPDNATTFDAEYVKKLREEAAKYRTDAKVNADAAAELAKLRESTKSEDEKVADRFAKLEAAQIAATAEALRLRVATKHGISEEDADLFLTGTDAETLAKQAARLSERVTATTTKKKPNVVPKEGTTTLKPGEDPVRAFTRDLFGRSDE